MKGKKASQTINAPVHKKSMRVKKNIEVGKIISKSNMAADSNDKSKIFDPKNSQAKASHVSVTSRKKKNKKKSINKYQNVQDQEISSTTTVIEGKKVSMVCWYFRGPFSSLQLAFYRVQ